MITIEGTITINDVDSKFWLDNDINGTGWAQYGAISERLSESMHIVESLQTALMENVGYYDEEK